MFFGDTMFIAVQKIIKKIIYNKITYCQKKKGGGEETKRNKMNENHKYKSSFGFFDKSST